MFDKSKYHFFWGGFLSQWCECEFSDSINKYCSAEQYMMYKKAMLFGDTNIASKILKENDPKAVKALGRKISGFNDATWDKFKQAIVTHGNYLKFSQNDSLNRSIIQTYPKILVEVSPYDKVWGIGMGIDDPNLSDTSKWGENLLGKSLMQVRKMLLVDNNFKP